MKLLAIEHGLPDASEAALEISSARVARLRHRRGAVGREITCGAQAPAMTQSGPTPTLSGATCLARVHPYEDDTCQIARDSTRAVIC